MVPASQADDPVFVVLVVDDEPSIRDVAIEALGDAGFVVVEAGHAEDALGILTARNDGVHVLFTDVHMPGAMDRLALAHHTRQHWPWIAVLVASGTRGPSRHEIPSGSRFLAKPYSLDVMVSHVRDLVGVAPP